MLHVILQILGFIGIALLCILGLLLLLVLLVLFVPIRYRTKGIKEGEVTRAEAKATYLLHMISVKFTYEEKMQLVARIFGIKVYDLAKKKAKEAVAEAEMAKESASDEQPAGESVSDGQAAGDAAKAQTIQEKTAQEESKMDSTKNMTEESVEKPAKESLFTKIKNKILGIIEKIKYTITSICDKIKNITETVSYYKQVLEDKENKALFKRVWERLCKVLKSIRPRKLKADLLIGTGSPDTTGYLCALYGMLSPILGEHVEFTADFEEKVFEGRFFAKGRITIFTILIQALKVFFDKQLQIFIKQLKREDK